MANKVYQDARSALEGALADGMMLMCGGFGLCRHPGEADPRRARRRRQGPRLRLKQRRHRRRGARPAARDRPGQEDDHAPTSARTRPSPSCSWTASSRSSSTRRARWPSASAPAAPASPPSTPRPASAPTWPRARRPSFDGAEYVMERGLYADFALVKAWKGDTAGNLVYRKTARNFNPMMATAAKLSHRRGRGARAESGAHRSRPRPHARHLRAAHLLRCAVRQEDRAAHHPQSLRSADSGEHDGLDPRADGGARRQGAEGRLLRQSRHRHPDAGRQLHPRRRRHRAAERERHAGRRPVPARRRGRPRPHQRGQADRDRGQGHLRISPRPTPSP